VFAPGPHSRRIDEEKSFSVAFIKDVNGVAVVPGNSLTIVRLSRRIELMRDDFPAFGRPMMAIERAP